MNFPHYVLFRIIRNQRVSWMFSLLGRSHGRDIRIFSFPYNCYDRGILLYYRGLPALIHPMILSVMSPRVLSSSTVLPSLIRPGNVSSARYPARLFLIAVRLTCRQEMPVKRTTINILMMTTLKSYPEIQGTRIGYVIRFTCPTCAAESIIVNKMPQDHFRNARVVSCRHCRTRLTILTPYTNRS